MPASIARSSHAVAGLSGTNAKNPADGSTNAAGITVATMSGRTWRILPVNVVYATTLAPRPAKDPSTGFQNWAEAAVPNMTPSTSGAPIR